MSEVLTTMMAVVCTDPNQNIIRTLYHEPKISGDEHHLTIICQGSDGLFVQSVPRNWINYVLVLNADYNAKQSSLEYIADPRDPNVKTWAQGMHAATRGEYSIYLPNAEKDIDTPEKIEIFDKNAMLLKADCTATQVQNGYGLGYLKGEKSYVIMNLANVKLTVSQKA